jgi:sec-independent protein translocase protein TatB
MASPMPKQMRAPAARARQRGFFDFSMSELAIIFGLALVVLGPKKLPGLVQQVGRWVGRARHMARQFREQLESEVNAINAVKPIPRNVPPVGPAVPETAPPPNVHHDPVSSTAATGVPETTTPEASLESAAPVTAPAPEPMPEQTHPEAQIYFALNGTEPSVVAHSPYETPPAADEPQAPAAHAENPTAPAHAPGAKSEEPQSPASVEVIFPHDHG